MQGSVRVVFFSLFLYGRAFVKLSKAFVKLNKTRSVALTAKPMQDQV